jgi:hypothetical protein
VSTPLTVWAGVLSLCFPLFTMLKGPGAQHLHDSDVLVKMLEKQKHQGRYYGGICAAPPWCFCPTGCLTRVRLRPIRATRRR